MVVGGVYLKYSADATRAPVGYAQRGTLRQRVFLDRGGTYSFPMVA